MSEATEQYVYQDADGVDLFRVVRGQDKSFYIQSRNGSGWKRGLNGQEVVPYNLPEILIAKNKGEAIWILEGEKDAKTGRSLGLPCTTNHGGAGKWRDEHSKWLRGAESVVVVWDRDDDGRKHAWAVHDSLASVGVERISFKRAAYGKDLTDHIGEGGTLSELVDQKPRRPKPKPKPKPRHNADLPIEDTPLVFQLILERLQGVKPELGKDHQYNAICPAHDDTHPSLSVHLDEERVLLKCQAGCDFEDIVSALGLQARWLNWAEQDQSDFERNVQERLDRLFVNSEAQIRFESLKAGYEYNIELLNRITLHEELQEPDTVQKYVVDQMMPLDGRTMIVAEEKAGKTSFCISLCKALCDSDSFLGRLISFDGRVCYLNGEMSKNMFIEWVRRAGFEHPERLVAKHLRGQTFPFWREDYMERVADWLALMKVGLLVIDTQYIFMRGMVANENDNLEVSRWQGAVDQLRNLAGVPNVLVVHHRGHTDDLHGRGASAIGAWPDVTWYLTKVGEKVKGERLPQDAPRSLSLTGRVDTFAPIGLDYDETTGLYNYGGISRSEQKLSNDVQLFVDRLHEFKSLHDRWPSIKEARSLVKKKTSQITDFLRDLEGRGRIERVADSSGVNCIVPVINGSGKVG